MIALTHDPKIDDPAIQEALNKKCFYIGALGSKKSHENRCNRLIENGFEKEEIKKIFDILSLKETKNIKFMKIQKTLRINKNLFQGTCGVGMNYFVGYKK